MEVHVYAIKLRTQFRGIRVREGVLLHGPAGWGEFSPFNDYTDVESAPWLHSALEAAELGWPAPVRDRVEVNATVPVVNPEEAHRLVARSTARTAKVKVADPRASLIDDCERVAAVRDALGPSGAIRVDANGAWDRGTAVRAIRELNRAADGLQYVEQPCASIEDLAAVRRKVPVRIAADESIRHAEDPMRVALAEAADIAVLKVAPLGGVQRALQVAEACGLPCVVSSAVESSVGLAAGVALACALPELDLACGLGTLSLLEKDVCAESLVPADGYLPALTTAPEPDLDNFPSANDEVTQRWLARMSRVLTNG